VLSLPALAQARVEAPFFRPHGATREVRPFDRLRASGEGRFPANNGEERKT
jgi:hypothetical protein